MQQYVKQKKVWGRAQNDNSPLPRVYHNSNERRKEKKTMKEYYDTHRIKVAQLERITQEYIGHARRPKPRIR